MSTKDDDDSEDAFRDAVKDAIPLLTDRIPHYSPKPRPIPVHSEADERQVMQEILDWEVSYGEPDADDTLSFCRSGVQKSAFRKLKKGYYSVARELDLHGMTVLEARLMLARFLLESREADVRCVRIIHGKGISSDNRGPVIKPMVNRWLRRRDEVLAFCPARPADGGTGAIYVLLKRFRN